MGNKLHMIKKFLFFLIISFALTSCNAFKPKKVNTRETPVNVMDRAKKNVNQGGGTSIGSLLGRGRGGSFEFSSSNPMWRASLEILDFIPMTTVDYSGGMIITDWYNEDNNKEAIKITIRFLSNEVRSDSLKVIVHKKKCSNNQNCQTSLLKKSTISRELTSSILRKAAMLENETKNKKRK